MSNTTQFEEAVPQELCDVVVGFDFGTSCSKIVLRTPYHYNQRAFAVPFGSLGHHTCRYLLPSVLWLGTNGKASLAQSPGACLVRDIKYHLMRNEPVLAIGDARQERTYDSKSVAVAFLALALRAARYWFLKHQGKLYRRLELRWTFNLGLPSSDFDDEALCTVYRHVAPAAWRLSLTPGDIDVQAAEEILGASHNWEELSDRDAAEEHQIPEVAAEVAGYARSTLRNEGLHILVDVGATTLDVCSFVLHEAEGDDRYELLTADVKPYGASKLYRYRVDAVRCAVDEHIGTLWNKYDPVSAMSDDIVAYAPQHEVIERAIKRQEEEYHRLCRERLWTTLLDLRIRRDPHSPRWRTEMPLFVSGGGSAMPFYQSLIDEQSERLAELYNPCQGIRRLSLSRPENFDADVDEQLYHRLAVAWGLSYPKTDIGDVSRPSDIEDIPPRERYDGGREFISKEMV